MWCRPTFWLTMIFLLVVSTAVVELGRRTVEQAPPQSQSLSTTSQIVRQPNLFPDDPTLGAAGAPVRLILFSDFECPFCAQVAPLLRTAVAAHLPQVHLVWKDFPLPQHAQAIAAAEAAQCAGAQGKFWEYHDLLFQSQDNLGEATYQTIATQLGLDIARFATCRARHERRPLIERNIQEGYAAGVNATPYLLVNGRAWSGIFTADELDGMLRQALGQ